MNNYQCFYLPSFKYGKEFLNKYPKESSQLHTSKELNESQIEHWGICEKRERYPDGVTILVKNAHFNGWADANSLGYKYEWLHLSNQTKPILFQPVLFSRRR